MSEGGLSQRVTGDPTAFLEHLQPRDEGAAHLARRLLDGEWRVESCFGPEQMDVWELVLARGSWRVRFGVERGFSDGVMAWRRNDDGSRGTVYCRMSEESFGDLVDDLFSGRIR